MRLTFKEFKKVFLKEGYSESDITILFKSIKSLNKTTKRWFVKWFFTGEYPTEKVEDVTVEFLVEKCGYKPANAFIIIDWLMADPDSAKYALLTQYDKAIAVDEKAKKDAIEYLKQQGKEPEVVVIEDTEAVDEE